MAVLGGIQERAASNLFWLDLLLWGEWASQRASVTCHFVIFVLLMMDYVLL